MKENSYNTIFKFVVFGFLLFEILFWKEFIAYASNTYVNLTITSSVEIGEQITVKVRIETQEDISTVAYTLSYYLPSQNGNTQGSINENIVCEEKKKYYEKEYSFDAVSAGDAVFEVRECHINDNWENEFNSSSESCEVISFAHSNAMLKSLEVEGQNIDFNSNMQRYNLYVSNDITSLTIHALPQVDGAKVTIHGNENFQVGENQILIQVTSLDGSSQKNYLINVIRSSMVTSSDAVKQNKLQQIGSNAWVVPGVFALAVVLALVLLGTDVFMLQRKGAKRDREQSLGEQEVLEANNSEKQLWKEENVSELAETTNETLIIQEINAADDTIWEAQDNSKNKKNGGDGE